MGFAWVATASAADFLPLETLSYAIDVVGPFAELTIRERFRNDGDTAVDALYVFPLEERAVVDGMWLRIETREIRGEIRARADARRVYDAARDAGQVAALTESAAVDVFTQDVSNLPPGAAVEVELRLVRPVDREGGVWTLPLAIALAPRFVPLGSEPIPVIPSRDTGVRADVEVTIHAATGVRWLTADPHPVVPDLLGARGHVRVDDLPLDRDLTVRWSTERAVPQASVLASDTHALLLLEGAASGSGRSWWDLEADFAGCPVIELTGAPSAVDDGAVFQAIGLRTGRCRGPVVVTGTSPEGPVRWELYPRPVPRPRALASAWARARVAATDDPSEVLALGLRWGIVTEQTSFVAVDPGSAGVKEARLRPPTARPLEVGWLPPPEAPPPVVVQHQQILLLPEREDREEPRDAPRSESAGAVLARKRPWEKTPLLVGGGAAILGGTALCALSERDRAPGPSGPCLAGLTLGAMGLGSLSFGVLLDDGT